MEELQSEMINIYSTAKVSVNGQVQELEPGDQMLYKKILYFAMTFYDIFCEICCGIHTSADHICNHLMYIAIVYQLFR